MILRSIWDSALVRSNGSRGLITPVAIHCKLLIRPCIVTTSLTNLECARKRRGNVAVGANDGFLNNLLSVNPEAIEVTIRYQELYWVFVGISRSEESWIRITKFIFILTVTSQLVFFEVIRL